MVEFFFMCLCVCLFSTLVMVDKPAPDCCFLVQYRSVFYSPCGFFEKDVTERHKL